MRRMTIGDKLPRFLRMRLHGRETVSRALDNSFWLLLDQLLRMAGGLIVGVWMARYLGPTRFGLLSYAQAIVAVVGACVSLGLNAVLVRDLVRTPAATGVLLGTASILKITGAMVGWAVCLLVAWLQPMADSQARLILPVVAASLIFQVLDVLDVFYQGRGESRVSAWGRMAGFVLASAARVALILSHAPLLAFAAVGTGELLFCGAGWLVAWRVRRIRTVEWSCEWTRARALLMESWPLALSGLAVYVQAYIDQVMLGTMLGSAELGQYAAAFRLVTAFSFLPIVLQTVAAPEITCAKRDDENLYRRRLHGLYRLMFILFLAIALPLMLLGPVITPMIFGPAYRGAAMLLPWLALRLFFANFGVARNLFITNEGLFRFSLVTALAGAAINVALNLIFIPAWGARGAIAASLVSFAATIFALDFLHSKLRANLRLMALAVVLPWRRLGD